MRRIVVVAIACLFAAVGPRLGGPRDRAAGGPFVYQPPEGFVLEKGDPAKSINDDISARDREWVHPATFGHTIAPRIHLSPSTKGGTVEAADLARISEGMPGMLEPTGVSWSEVRRETRTRADGARVGLIEGECTKTTEQLGAGPVKVKYRRLLFVFPTDEGSAVTTAVYGTDETATWQAAFEGSIDKAQGVALRVPPPPTWMYFAWGAAGAVLAWLAASLKAKRDLRLSMAPPPMPPPKDRKP
ncbi:MAG: hypothetical protein JWO86_8722 [Myxococcaceae bacterium]|jgi:hypothetical protein|nr:hypothetical protein [Myxococcaceae bacterium]MEA2746291.1 hypothetical protein [Myxococcales bacterium]